VDEHEPYALVRLSALTAHHDRGMRGISDGILRRLIRAIDGRVRLFITSERPIPSEFEQLRLRLRPERIHDALACAEFLVGDSQSMTMEAAMLGTPVFRLSDFVGRLSVVAEVESYGLAFGYRPEATERLIQAIDALIVSTDRKEVSATRLRKFLRDKIDPLPWFVDLLEEMGSSARD
jgi:predicted glycosyltransferase